MENLLTKKLTREEQDSILEPLFGIRHEKCGEDHYVLYDEEGDEFYGRNANCQFDFSTLAGIFSYQAHLMKLKGRNSIKAELESLMKYES